MTTVVELRPMRVDDVGLLSDSSDREAVIEHLRLHEQGKTSYIEMSTGLAGSGVETWTVDTRAMTLTFADERGTAHVVEAIGS